MRRSGACSVVPLRISFEGVAIVFETRSNASTATSETTANAVVHMKFDSDTF